MFLLLNSVIGKYGTFRYLRYLYYEAGMRPSCQGVGVYEYRPAVVIVVNYSIVVCIFSFELSLRNGKRVFQRYGMSLRRSCSCRRKCEDNHAY